MTALPPIGLGCMRLSTERDRDEAAALAVLHAAFDEGLTILDTADAYCWDDSERGHNERLIARAIASWAGDRSHVRVATKGGLIRPDGRWVSDGRARHLTTACADSLRALGVDRIHLYQLHAPDPGVPFATSVRALAALKREGLVEEIGLCNVTVGQIEQARRIVDISTIQVELSVWQDANVLSGVVEYCIAHGIRLLAYRPLGGASRRQRTMTDPTLLEIAQRHAVTAPEVALAWLMDLSPLVVPIPGATTVDSVRSIARARSIDLSGGDRALLDERFPAGRALRRTAGPQPTTLRDEGEVVLIMGLPGAGKSTVAEGLRAQGYLRLNRDDAGGTLRDVTALLDDALVSGASRVVLDNTYVSRRSRAEVIRAANARGLPVRCIWLSTSVEDAQVNAAERLVARYGELPGDTALAALRKKDVAAFAPTVQFKYQRALEPPDPAEGFSRIAVMPFERRRDEAFVNRAVIVWCDGLLLRSRSGARVPRTPDDVDVDHGRGAILRVWRDEGWRVLGMSWQPEIAEGLQSTAGADAVFARMNHLLALDIAVAYCPHAAGPPTCWCRKPLPGLGVLFVQHYELDASTCLYVGEGPQDPGFARRLGFQYRDAKEFFAHP
jgi:aryl-alcohol dehydrogenase-like predicted oxidoreductase/predicted kinase/histidinol phosphatase-like enzyme